MSIVKEHWMKVEEQLLDEFRLGQITRDEFVRKHEELLGYDHEEAVRYADETADFLEHMSQR